MCEIIKWEFLVHILEPCLRGYSGAGCTYVRWEGGGRWVGWAVHTWWDDGSLERDMEIGELIHWNRHAKLINKDKWDVCCSSLRWREMCDVHSQSITLHNPTKELQIFCCLAHAHIYSITAGGVYIWLHNILFRVHVLTKCSWWQLLLRLTYLARTARDVTCWPTFGPTKGPWSCCGDGFGSQQSRCFWEM